MWTEPRLGVAPSVLLDTTTRLSIPGIYLPGLPYVHTYLYSYIARKQQTEGRKGEIERKKERKRRRRRDGVLVEVS